MKDIDNITKPQKLKKIVDKTCLAFTLIVLSFTMIMYLTARSDTAKFFATTASMLFCILLFSFILALSELIFDFGKLGNTAKRLLHFVINFASLWISFFLVPGKVAMIKEFIIMAFLFMVLYVFILGLGALFRNLSEKINNF
ncbi:MAG: hypothetical protein PHV95_02045 [Eubacteriales bacterium]|nr:hypothetical protein [Eubacteriales bacterium]